MNMNTMHDALKTAKARLEATEAADIQMVNGETLTDTTEQSALSVSAPVANVQDEEGLAKIIRGRMAQLQQFVAGRDLRDAKLRERQERFAKNEINLRNLYSQKMEIERLVEEETFKLAKAKKTCFVTQDILVVQVGVDELTQYLAQARMEIIAIESDYPEIKAKLDEERHLIKVGTRFLERFAKETNETGVRYLAKGTPVPSAGNVKEADAFLLKSIKEAHDLGIIVLAVGGEAAVFIAHNGSRWNPAHADIMEEAEICKEFGMYEKAIHLAEQKKLQEWADKDAAAGLLLIPSHVEAQKKSPHNRHSLLNMVRFGEGFCFVPIDSKKPADLLSYHGVRPEMKVEYGAIKEGNQKHMLRVASVTAPQFVEDFFFPEESDGKPMTPTFYFNHIHEIATWRQINRVVRDSLVKGIRWAESWEKESGVMKELGDVSRISLKTLDQFAIGASGTARIRVPKPRYINGFDIGFEIVSDGITVRPGHLATDRSKKLPVYEEIMDGQLVAEFFARAKDGSFCNEDLQDLACRNEAFELSWLMPVAMAEYAAECISADNVAALVMLSDAGGRDGAYILNVSVRDKRGDEETTKVETYRQVAYVVRRENDTLVFIAGLTHYSVDRLTEQGFALNTPYGLGELKGFVLHILRKVYSKVSDMPYDKLPEHLKGARAKIAQGAGVAHPAVDESASEHGDQCRDDESDDKPDDNISA